MAARGIVRNYPSQGHPDKQCLKEEGVHQKA